MVKATTAESGNPNVGVSIGTLKVTWLTYSYGTDIYVGNVSENTTIEFCIDSEIKSARVVSITTTDTSVTVPDSICCYNNTYPVTCISDFVRTSGPVYHNPFPANMSSLTVPSTVKSIESYNYNETLDEHVESMYMLGDVPEIKCSYNNYYSSAKNVFVCNKTYLRNYLSSNSFSYSENILPYGWDYTSATVDVKKAGEFAETYLSQNDYDWDAVHILKVTGNINSDDLKSIRRLTSLIRLDLSETLIEKIPANFMSSRGSLLEIKLPSTVNTIEAESFSYCYRLQSVAMEGVKEIKSFAFKNCIALTDINLNGVQNIYENAFENCSHLDNVDLSTVKYIGKASFSGCSSLKAANLDSIVAIGYMSLDSNSNDEIGDTFLNCTSLKTINLGNKLQRIGFASFKNTAIDSIVIPEGLGNIPAETFSGCRDLRNVIFPTSLRTIMEGAFERCSSLSYIEIPNGLTSIADNAFYWCSSLEKAILPATLSTIGNNAFFGTAIKEMTCYAAIPPAASEFIGGNGIDMTHACLYVPSFSKTTYFNNETWNIFNIIKPIETEIDNIYIDRPLVLDIDKDINHTITSNTNVTLWWDYYIGELTICGDGVLSIGEFNVTEVLRHRSNIYSPICPTLIVMADKMRANNVTHNILFDNDNGSGEWHFISLPYDVKVSDIVPGNNTYWVIRRYDSTARAAGNTSSTWVNLTNDDILEAGKGYIVSAYASKNEAGYTIIPKLTFKSGNSLTKNNIFQSTDVIVPLSEFATEFAHNRSWNLIGNPYPCYFDMHHLNEEFTAPVTVWNGNSYVAYSPVDDDLVLAPYEAFFVQCPLDVSEMIFKESGRLHSHEGGMRFKAPIKEQSSVLPEERNVFNFKITHEEFSDRARIVLNPDASMEYELGRDASKFFADHSEYAQIYVSDDINYSISERPVSDGRATLGLRTDKEDTYILSLSGRYCPDWHVIVTDNETGISVDLTQNDYPFTATAGDTNNRFAVKFQLGSQSGIASVIADFGNDANVTVTGLNGVSVYSGRLSEINVPSAGIYIISNGTETRKIILK